MKNLFIALVAFALFIAGAVWAAEPAPKKEVVDLPGILSLARLKAGTIQAVVWHNDLLAVDTTCGDVWMLKDTK